MPCKSCSSDNVDKFLGELTASSPQIKNVRVPPVYVCQEVLICLDCGFAELRVPATELKSLQKRKGAFGN